MLRFIKKFTEDKIDYVKLGNTYYQADKTLLDLDKTFSQNPEMIGMILGEEKQGKFFPSLALLEILSKISEEKVFVKGFGEMDFIYGKDLKDRHIERVEGETKVGFLKLVQNMKDENIGYAKIISPLDSKGIILKNKLDRGDFLRREN